MSFSKEEYKQRLLKVQSLMREKKIDLIISHDTNNMNYLTGYDAWSFYYAQCVLVCTLIQKNQFALLETKTQVGRT